MRKIRTIAKSAVAESVLPKIATYMSRNPILHSQTKPIGLNHLKLSQIIKHLKTMASQAGTCSLSANQLSYPYNIFTCLNPSKLISNQWLNYQNVSPDDYNIMINPSIVQESAIEQYIYQECVSLYGLRFPIKRSSYAVFQYQNQNKQTMTQLKKGFEARVWMHQLSHSKGRLALDMSLGEVELSDDFATQQFQQQMLQLKNMKASYEQQIKRMQEQEKSRPKEEEKKKVVKQHIGGRRVR